uniref:Uncharacterized protein n=1 Tax=Pararge aegeria TaxID=116150 RepID=S4PM80_9NEOP
MTFVPWNNMILIFLNCLTINKQTLWNIYFHKLAASLNGSNSRMIYTMQRVRETDKLSDQRGLDYNHGT